MKRERKVLLSLSIALALSLVSAAAFVPGAQAQTDQKEPRPRDAEDLRWQQKMAATKFRSLKPKDLDLTAKVNLVKQVFAPWFEPRGLEANPISGFVPIFKVTPREGVIAGKASLRLFSTVVDYENAYAVIPSFKDLPVINAVEPLINAVECEFSVPEPGKYFIDFAVHSGYDPAVTYSYGAMSSSGRPQMGGGTHDPQSTGHVAFVYSIVDTGLLTVARLNADREWVFYSCEVSLIKQR